MACMDHSCECGYVWFDNIASGDCPKCGSRVVAHAWDEIEDDEEEIYDDE